MLTALVMDTVSWLIVAGAAGFTGIYFFFQIRDSSRPCPRCGDRVKARVMTCNHCGFDFNTIGNQNQTGTNP